MIRRVDITPEAAALLARLVERHGPLLFHQSGGCCDGSVPMCFPASEFKVGGQDVLLGEIGGCSFYTSAFLYEYWKNCHLTIDIVEGRGNSFSVEAPEGVRFITHSRLFGADELAELARQGSADPAV
jgi:uncharacterized protein (DUF779 family)